ncbi:UDP-N-acetyl glucosamine 2-epimerase [archaeon]|nr:MAG: UDP-N-acetyl glucosamine 2-epimerase [archaeon]
MIELPIKRDYLPIRISEKVIKEAVEKSKASNRGIIAIVTATKPDFYKQAPVAIECMKQDMPFFIINTGQHFDDVMGYGLKEFGLEKFIACDLQVRGDLMEKSSEMILKLGTFGRHLKKEYGATVLPVVHGDTLAAGVSPLAWIFSLGQKVAQNEAGIRSMAPVGIKNIKAEPSENDIENFIDKQFNGKWMLMREEPFPEQIDTWICAAGTEYFFAPCELAKDNLLREGFPEDRIYTVGNSGIDAIDIKRKEKPSTSIFEHYPQLEKGEWIRVDIHRRGNLTPTRFKSIVQGVTDLVKDGYNVILVELNATKAALNHYNLRDNLVKLAEEHKNFLFTPLWKEYSHVIEFLDSKHCAIELTDSGSMQEELLYFKHVMPLTVRLNTDRPETIFQAKNNLLVPPISASFITKMVKHVEKNETVKNKIMAKKQIYGKPGEISMKIVEILERENTADNIAFRWVHQRLKLWNETSSLDYL